MGEAPPRSADAFVARSETSQRGLVHRLPRARVVDRLSFLQAAVEGQRTVHVGFADAGYRELHQEKQEWLHAHLAAVTADLVGIDLDDDGVAAATADGYEAYQADCCDPAAIAALALDPARVIVAGEIIEHLDNPGGFLDALHGLADTGTRLVITTPNAYGWVNPIAALAGREVNHPDHIVMYTWRTLSEMLRRHGWEIEATATYVPSVKADDGEGLLLRILGLGARAILAVQRLVGRAGAPFVADGLIVVARPSAAGR